MVIIVIITTLVICIIAEDSTNNLIWCLFQEDMRSGYSYVLPHLAALRGAAPLCWAFMRVRAAVFHVNVCLLQVLPLRFIT